MARAGPRSSGVLDAGTRDHLFSAAYDELRRLAASVRRDDPSRTLSPTALVNEAWLARKVVLQFPDAPFFVLAVHAGSRWKPRGDSHVRKLAKTILPGLGLHGTVMLVDQLTQKALARHVRSVSGSRVYRRAR